MTTPISSMAFVFVGSFIGSFGAAFLKAGAHRVDRNLMALLTNWRLAAGIAAYVLSSMFFVMGVKHGELTILYPLVSLGYMWTLLWSRIFFGEPLNSYKFMGLGLILCGVTFLGLGNR